MLNYLKLTNFRKHESKELSFGAGLQVIRGLNEAGKTTILEAIGYALFGVSACRQPLDAVVTWGKPVSALKVELGFTFDGVQYRIVRGKSGAELTYGGAASVTGQREVGAFIERLLGVTEKTVNRLMLAGQGAIRGALSQGPKATMDLIEELADFGKIDQVVDLIQERLATGHTAPQEQRLQDVNTRLNAAVDACVEPDLSDLAALEASAKEQATQAEQALAGLDVAGLSATIAGALEAGRAHANAVKAYDAARAKVEQLVEMQALYKGKTAGPSAAEVEAAFLAKQRVEQQSYAAQDYRNLKAWNEDFDGPEWEGTIETLCAEMVTLKDQDKALTAEIAKAETEIRVREERRVVSSVCGLCNQDVSKFPDVAQKNAQINLDIAHFKGVIKRAQEARKPVREDLQALDGLRDRQQALQDTFNGLIRQVKEGRADWGVAEDRNFVPWRLTWVGDAPTDDPAKLHALAVAHEALQRQYDAASQAAGKLQATTEQLAQAEATLLAAREEVKATEALVWGPRALEKLQDALKAAQAETDRLKGVIETSNVRIRECEFERRMRALRYEEAVKAVQVLRDDLRRETEALAELERNNALLKRVRQARPVIADRLWNLVLAAVSHHFGEMRGEASIVTREANGFLVDGQPIEGLSGSTLDILGNGIRLALTRTFLPAVDFLVLDEPFAAADAHRTERSIGVLLASHFEQILLVTHEEVSADVAAALIEV